MTTALVKASVALIALNLLSVDIQELSATENMAFDESQSSTAIHDIGVPGTGSIFGTFELDRLGGEKITIWNDVNDGRRYYYLPSLLPEWAKFEEDIIQQCDTTNSDALINANLRILLSDIYYEEEIREKIAEFSGRDSIQEYVLSAIPYDNIQIILKVNAAVNSQLIYDARSRSRLLSDADVEAVPLLSYPREIETTITASCGALEELVSFAMAGKDILGGRIYFQGVTYRTTSFYVQMNQFLDSDRSLELFGDESMVSRMTFTNTHGIEKDEFGDKLMMRLPRLKSTGSGEFSRQRLLSRDYVNYISSNSFASIVGGCVEADTNSNRCVELRERFLNFVIDHAESVKLTFKERESGVFELSAGQVAYATISPQEYTAIARAAPTFDVTVDDETVKTADNIVWKFGGDGPIPTVIELVILDEQSLRDVVDVYWYERVPVQDSARQLVAMLDYFSLRIGDRRILLKDEYAEWKRIEFSCQSGGSIVRLRRQNVQRRGGGISQGFRLITHHDRSHRCAIRFRGGWNATEGHFFLINLGEEALSIPERWAAGGWSFDVRLDDHDLDVPRQDGAPQMLTGVNYSGSARRGHSWFRRLPCGARVRFNLQQYPEYCAPFVVEGYSTVRGTQGASTIR